jgi:hypothetical protein
MKPSLDASGDSAVQPADEADAFAAGTLCRIETTPRRRPRSLSAKRSTDLMTRMMRSCIGIGSYSFGSNSRETRSRDGQEAFTCRNLPLPSNLVSSV